MCHYTKYLATPLMILFFVVAKLSGSPTLFSRTQRQPLKSKQSDLEYEAARPRGRSAALIFINPSLASQFAVKNCRHTRIVVINPLAKMHRALQCFRRLYIDFVYLAKTSFYCLARGGDEALIRMCVCYILYVTKAM